MKNKIINHFDDTLKALLKTRGQYSNIKSIADILLKKINSKNKIFVFGNGGSYADSSHFVGELTSTYSKKNRKALPFYLLSSNIAALTAWSNDFKYEDYLIRELSGYYQKGDVLILLSTSGGNYRTKQSINLIKLVKFAKKKKIFVISLLGKGGGVLKKISNKSIIVDSINTGSIQEIHKMILHSICAYIDDYF